MQIFLEVDTDPVCSGRRHNDTNLKNTTMTNTTCKIQKPSEYVIQSVHTGLYYDDKAGFNEKYVGKAKRLNSVDAISVANQFKAVRIVPLDYYFR